MPGFSTDARLDQYERSTVIGQGGMGKVYDARHKGTDTRVALKTMHHELVDDPALVERFRREARAIARLEHENVCRLLACGAQNRELFLILEFVEGPSASALKRTMGGRMPLEVALEIVRQLLLGLSEAHESGIVHRDVKPSNMLITPYGVVKLLDFGIAKTHGDTTLTGTGALMGTTGFMSPEQARGENVDERSDLFSVGLVLHDLASGRSPFATDNPAEGLLRVTRERAPPLSESAPCVSMIVDQWCANLTEVDPSRRTPTARKALEDLDEIQRSMVEQGPLALTRAVAYPRETAAKMRARWAKLYIARAEERRRHGAIEAAVYCLEEALRAEPEDVRARALHEELSNQLIRVRTPEETASLTASEREAIAALRKAESPALWRHLGRLRLERGNVSGAVWALRRAVFMRSTTDLVDELARISGDGVAIDTIPSIRTPAAAGPAPPIFSTTPGPPLETTALSPPSPDVPTPPGAPPSTHWRHLGSHVAIFMLGGFVGVAATILYGGRASDEEVTTREPSREPSPAPSDRLPPRAPTSLPPVPAASEIEGPALVNVWLEGCADCMPAFTAWRDLVARGQIPAGLNVYNVSFGKSTKAFARDYNVSQGLRRDRGDQFVNRYGIRTFTTLLVDRSGNVAAAIQPTAPDYVERLADFSRSNP